LEYILDYRYRQVPHILQQTTLYGCHDCVDMCEIYLNEEDSLTADIEVASNRLFGQDYRAVASAIWHSLTGEVHGDENRNARVCFTAMPFFYCNYSSHIIPFLLSIFS